MGPWAVSLQHFCPLPASKCAAQEAKPSSLPEIIIHIFRRGTPLWHHAGSLLDLCIYLCFRKREHPRSFLQVILGMCVELICVRKQMVHLIVLWTRKPRKAAILMECKYQQLLPHFQWVNIPEQNYSSLCLSQWVWTQGFKQRTGWFLLCVLSSIANGAILSI